MEQLCRMCASEYTDNESGRCASCIEYIAETDRVMEELASLIHEDCSEENWAKNRKLVQRIFETGVERTWTRILPHPANSLRPPEEVADMLPGKTIIQAFAEGDHQLADAFLLVLSDGTVVRMSTLPSTDTEWGIAFGVTRKMSKSAI